jgi:uncharacterized membrane protein
MKIEELKELIESKKQPVVINKGIGPLSLLGIAFVVMKITGYISWSWWLVLAPFWIPVVLALTLIVLILAAIAFVVFKSSKIDTSILDNVSKETDVKVEVTTEETTKKKKSNNKANGKGTKKENEQTSN